MTLEKEINKYIQLRNKLLNKEIKIAIDNQFKLKEKIQNIKSNFNNTYIGCSKKDRNEIDKIYETIEKDLEKLCKRIEFLKENIEEKKEV